MPANYTMEQYIAMKATERKKILKDDLLDLIETQIGQPTVIPEETLRIIIKDTIDKSIEEKIPNDIGKLINDMKEDYDSKIEVLQNDNHTLKNTILEQQKFLEGMRRDKVKSNVFISGLPSSHKIGEDDVTNKSVILEHLITYINSEMTSDNYKVIKIFEPTEGRTKYSAKVAFNDYATKMSLINNCKKLGTLNDDDPLKKVRVRFDDPPLTRQENRRLSSKLYQLRQANTDESILKLEKGKLLKDGVVIDEFNLINQVFA